MPFDRFKKQMAHAIASELKHPDISAAFIESEFGIPPKTELGHIALPCFQISKILGRPSVEIAKELGGKNILSDITIQTTGPYVNFRKRIDLLCFETLGAIFSQGPRFGSDSSGAGEKVVIEYCSPNIAKKLAFQHIRSTLIGNTLANIYDFLGYKTERINFIGDWGTQFARLLTAVKLWGSEELFADFPSNDPMQKLFELYVRFHDEIEKDESLLDKAALSLKELEQSEAKSTQLWKQIRSISISSMEKTLRRMKVQFNHIEGESRYVPGMCSFLAEIKRLSGARLSEGAYVVDVPDIPTPALIQKRDGTTLYLTRDIAAAVDRYKRFSFDKMLYIVSEQQKLHFRHLFGLLKKTGYEWSDRCEHLAFGTVLFESGKMSTRKGKVVFLDELLNEAKELALEECTKKNPDLKSKEETSEMVGIGALIFGELSTHRQRDINFDWKNVLSLDGETGPYVQYSLVRCHSLLKKAAEKGLDLQDLNSPVNEGYLFPKEEEVLVVSLSKLRSTLRQAVRENEPFYLTRYLIDVAKTFNRFYYQLPVLQASDMGQKMLRLKLVMATRQVLTNGLTLLGIGCPKEM